MATNPGREVFDLPPFPWKKSRVSPSTILEVQRLSRTYPTAGAPLTVLHEISFALAAGDSCAIVGPSGSGKTTLLGLCAGLDTPTAGAVRVNGIDLGQLDEDGRARVRNEHVGFVFQNFQLLPTLTALENVMVPMELRGTNHIAPEAKELLKLVGLGERLHHYPVQLSGGEQQRVALARAFMNRPKLLFADEPTGNLDTETGHQIIEALFQLNRERGTTLVLVTHDQELAERAGRIIRLRGGQLVGDSRPPS
jgi:putative ABC transport system ATP-binding protein